MWDNLGRIAGEYPHLPHIRHTGERPRIAIDQGSYERLANLKADGYPAVLCNAHIANWEVAPRATADAGLPLSIIYRKPNNPYVAWLLDRIRARSGAEQRIAKSRHGAFPIMRSLQSGGHIGLMFDQKHGEGMWIELFGVAAKTSALPVALCRKFNAPLVPARIVRTKGARFRIQVEDPIPLNTCDGHKRADEDVLRDLHNHLEAWIRETPGQWLWLHRRWPGASSCNLKTKELSS